jgi:hypothetical protein
MNTPKDIKRHHVRNSIESQFHSSIEKRIDRYLEIEHQGIIGGYYFAAASSECIYLYRDGYFIAAVMMSHAINEGIMKFVFDRNNLNKKKSKTETKTIAERINELKEKNLISTECAEASYRIWKSYRADIHHMNPNVTEIDFRKFAKKNLNRLSLIESEIFNHKIKDGIIVPTQPKYWNIGKDGVTPVFLRLE